METSLHKENNQTPLHQKTDYLIEKIELWAKEKGILDAATPFQQFQKTEEEFYELKEAMLAHDLGLETFINSKGVSKNTREEILDAIGDVTVTLIILSKLLDTKFSDNLENVYNIISKRTGKMLNGQFVKDNE